ncbi:MAG: preprotein translocase subunit SecA, partial [Planctomycetes bacterium]|nr:preprotein translocase subunit SecA [Planctomycetota bacterium]
MNGLSVLSNAVRFVWPHAVHPAESDRVVVARIRQAAEPLARQTDRNLEERARELRHAVQEGAAVTGEDVLTPAFALVFESARRTIGIEFYDVQLLAGLALARGFVAEMQTGEGKTFVAALPAFLHALSGNGVHLMTVTPYLAGRDYDLLAPVYRLLGTTVGLVQADADVPEKRMAYECDVTYGPGYEFGFDYLRDQVALLARRKPKLGEQYRDLLRGKTSDGPLHRQRGHSVAIVDEADSVMLDEATTPLILAAGGAQPAPNADVYQAAAKVADELVE